MHLVERVLPHVPYRQWTLSFPRRVRWVLLKDVGLLSDVLTLFLRAGASPAATEGTAAGPTGWASCCRVIHPVLRLCLRAAGGRRALRGVATAHARGERGALPGQGPEDALQAYQAHSLQQRLRWTEVDVQPPPRKQPRCAFLEGFSLHSNTHLHANDRQGLERLCRYGARGALALERLSRAEDGRIAWRMKRPLPDGTTHLFFTGLEYLMAPSGVRAILEHLGLPSRPAKLAPAQGPPQRAWC
ncbi:Transposase, IS801/IS1294 [Stigmatella aurantiaca DW4/3-1]|uniref:Transposase n=1 Tax=Stigmatella aurantiaca (strain DW4/3-1) TaxID=378806 RepID=Q08PY7_STIAD|nr:Transposase, IS801/IS1294 [Stigmatella aurantiaca DW4/3-1]EAU62549.1 transposase [Stigmatella aurantiaca DW4/3-1]